MAPSYQLPDLLNLVQPFELRTNKSCRSATTASEAWLLGLKTAELNDVLTSPESTTLRPAKAGLLAALCFPACDPPQLRFFTDFLSILIISAERLKRARSLEESGWHEGDNDTEDGVKLLGRHNLFQYLESQLRRISSKAQPTWQSSFSRSVHSYHSAQLHIIANRLNNVIPDIDQYISLRRNLSGFFMLFDLVELTESMTLPPMDEKAAEKLLNLKQITADIIGCSLDVVAFNNDQAQGNRHNLIAIIMAQRRLTVQGALNLAGTMIKQMFDSFHALERSLLDPPTPTPPPSNHSGNATLFAYRNWISFAPAATPPSPPSTTRAPNVKYDGGLLFLDDLPSYVQVFKDCIVGTINWAYETELYFGKKGEEIRTFGWVFLNPKIEPEEVQ